MKLVYLVMSEARSANYGRVGRPLAAFDSEKSAIEYIRQDDGKRGWLYIVSVDHHQEANQVEITDG